MLIFENILYFTTNSNSNNNNNNNNSLLKCRKYEML